MNDNYEKLKDDTPLVTPDTTKASPGVKVEPAASNKGPPGAFHMPGKILVLMKKKTVNKKYENRTERVKYELAKEKTQTNCKWQCTTNRGENSRRKSSARLEEKFTP